RDAAGRRHQGQTARVAARRGDHPPGSGRGPRTSHGHADPHQEPDSYQADDDRAAGQAYRPAPGAHREGHRPGQLHDRQGGDGVRPRGPSPRTAAPRTNASQAGYLRGRRAAGLRDVDMQARRGFGAWGMLPLACIVFLAGGCRQNRDLTEAELRSKERDLYTLRDELSRSEAFNEALRREVVSLRGGSTANLGPGAAGQSYAVTTVTLGRQTGGYDADDIPGDEALQVLLEPKDPDGHTIKAPGTVEVQAFEI